MARSWSATWVCPIHAATWRGGGPALQPPLCSDAYRRRSCQSLRCRGGRRSARPAVLCGGLAAEVRLLSEKRHQRYAAAVWCCSFAQPAVGWCRLTAHSILMRPTPSLATTWQHSKNDVAFSKAAAQQQLCTARLHHNDEPEFGVPLHTSNSPWENRPLPVMAWSISPVGSPLAISPAHYPAHCQHLAIPCAALPKALALFMLTSACDMPQALSAALQLQWKARGPP